MKRPLILAAGLVVLALIAVIDVLVYRSGWRRRRAMAFLLAWVCPGAGHALMGKWRKGLFFFAILVVTYVFGLWLSGWRTISFDDNPFYHVGQYGSGLTALLGAWLGDPKAFPRDDLPKSWFDPGLLYVCVAGLLNVVIMLSVLDIASASEKQAGESPAPQAQEGKA
ncbi:MAG: hypothetical protein HYY16_14030 [Planctomycetes bacterium]|nr:hypothetical protein [Planctomycetota bacterium]